MNTLVHVNKEKFEKIFNHSLDSIFIIHPATDRILDANPAACKLLGYTVEELLNTPISVIHADEMPELMSFTSKVYSKGDGWTDKLKCLTKNREKINVEISATQMVLHGLNCIIVIARDVSARVTAETEVKRRLNFEELISSISTKFLQAKSSELDDLILNTLKAVGNFAGVDRCYIYQDIKNNGHYINTSEWLKEGLPNLQEIQNSLDPNHFNWVHNQLKEFDTVHIPDVNELPETEPHLRENLQFMGIKSCLVVPLNYSGNLAGFVGFDSLSSSKVWSDYDKSLLKVVGEIIFNGLERKKHEDNLEQINTELNELNMALEIKVNQRAQEIISQRDKLTNYAYYNAHKLRAPLARLLGLT
ncbi:MAG: GAF domain-containing protein, partial [Bacteroidota bacterium]